MLTVSVTPAGAGWAVRSAAFDNDMVFRSGARAEAAAKRLGEALAAAGQPVEIEVLLRGGARAGRFLCLPPVREDIFSQV
jgi:hypothetical protein